MVSGFLSALVTKNQIPSQLATKLMEKLKEKNVKITKEQLNSLAEKIRLAMRNMPTMPVKPPEPQTPKRESLSVETSKQPKPENQDMKALVDMIEKLQKRLTDVEQQKTFGKKPSSGKMVT